MIAVERLRLLVVPAPEALPWRVALAFEGYTLVGAAWSWEEGGSMARYGPYLMPQYRGRELAAWLSDAIRDPQSQVSWRSAAPAASAAKSGRR